MTLVRSLVSSVVSSAVSSVVRSGASTAAAVFPSTNRQALWLMRNYVSASYTIPNSWAATADDANVLKDAGHLAGSTGSGLSAWGTSNVTLTADQTGPDGQTSATRVLAGAANGELISSGVSVPAGTWTLVVPIKSNTGAGQTVKIGHATAGLVSKSVTTSWAEYSTAFTLGAAAGGLRLARDDGSNTLDVLIGTPRMYPGDVTAAVPAATALAGHLKFGLHQYPTPSGTNYTSFDGPSNQHGMAHWNSGIDFSTGDSTHFHIVRLAADPTGIGELFALRANTQAQQFGLRGHGKLTFGDSYAETRQFEGLKFAGDGWQVLGCVCDSGLNERRFYVGRQLVGIVTGIGANTMSTGRDFVVGGAAGGWFTGDWIGGGVYNRALSATEWATLVSACEGEMTLHSQTKGTVRSVVVIDGDSITSNSSDAQDYYASQAATVPLSPRRYLINLAVPGDGYTQVNGRRTTRQRLLSDTANRSYYWSVWWTNGVENASGGTTYLTNLASVCADAKTDGFTKILACTLTPKTQANYNTNRNIANAGIVVGGNIAAVCDFAGDSRYGDDADASDAGLYPDGSHPTTTVEGYMAERWGPAVNAL